MKFIIRFAYDVFIKLSNWLIAENLSYILFYIFRRRWLQTLCLLWSRYYYGGDEWIRRLHDNRMWWSLGYGNPNECNYLCVQPTSDWQRLVIWKNVLLMFRYRFIFSWILAFFWINMYLTIFSQRQKCFCLMFIRHQFETFAIDQWRDTKFILAVTCKLITVNVS